MPVTIPIKKDVQSCLYAMGTMSPGARRFLEGEHYRLMLDDDEDMSPDRVMRTLFMCVQADLQQLGIIFNIDYDSVYYDDDMFVSFINLCWVLLPNTLYPAVAKSDELKNLIYGIVEGSIGDDGPALLTYLRELAGIDTPIAMIPQLTEVISYLYPVTSSNSLFMDYLQTLVMNFEEQKLLPDVDPARHDAFVAKVKDLLWRWMAVRGAIESSVTPDELTSLDRGLKLWEKDLRNADHVIDYQFMFLNKPEEIPDGIRIRWEQKWFWYHVSSPLFLDYYVARKTEPERLEMLRILTGAYMFCATKEAFDKEVARFQSLYPQAELPCLSDFQQLYGQES